MKQLLTTLVLFGVFGFTEAQNEIGVDSKHSSAGYSRQRWMVMVRPIQFAFVEFPVIGEYSYNKNGFGLLFGFRPAYKKNLPLIEYEYVERLWENYRALNYFNPLQNSVTVGTYYKVYFLDSYLWHIKTEVFYRHWWFNEKQTEYEDKVRFDKQGYQFKGLRTESQDVYAIQASWGWTFQVSTKFKYDYFIETCVGIGFRYRTFLYETRDGEFWGEPIDYNLERGHDFSPTLQLGLNMGFGAQIK